MSEPTESHEEAYLSWHKENHSAEEHALFLRDGIIPSPKN
jgi:hypothetical protein